MTTTTRNGRLCNQIIRNLAVHMIAKKNDLFVNYYNYDLIKKLGIDLFIGTKTFEYTISLTDANYFEILNQPSINTNLNPNDNYFQTDDIIKLLYNYLHSSPIKNEIIKSNPYQERYNNNNDLFIHVRLGDVAYLNPGSDYYIRAIKQCNFEKIHITSDDINHQIIKDICTVYPNAILFYYDEIKTIQFGSTCKTVILSHGSFSAVIGYLSFFSKIYYPKHDPTKLWYGDMFSFKDWICI